MATKTNDPATDTTDPLRDTEGGHTKVEQGGDSAPRLPHERDQSSESQETPDGEPTRVGKQGAEDVKRGLVDTDRGPVTDRVYNDKVKR
ncbi:hypothetical protein [Variovorax sp. PAMC 28711]|uniref:hypothetical protein n=1 Tax=Variovorax sp. PAMC 28711 TaxID=1795631 RepID=UPI00078DF5A7|nr:hypothetical protein [Variovorax sp. PAMC 28711]AMM25077.1 hypothetical protein AX767_12420 [Variovorax sp. PAMC 28711]